MSESNTFSWPTRAGEPKVSFPLRPTPFEIHVLAHDVKEGRAHEPRGGTFREATFGDRRAEANCFAFNWHVGVAPQGELPGCVVSPKLHSKRVRSTMTACPKAAKQNLGMLPRRSTSRSLQLEKTEHSRISQRPPPAQSFHPEAARSVELQCASFRAWNTLRAIFASGVSWSWFWPCASSWTTLRLS